MEQTEIIKERLPIEQVIGSYIRLEPNGAGFKARCPFHVEKTASFSITPSKGMFYCYGCQKGGDIFTFVQEIEKINFKEALEKLAADAGVDLKKDNKNQSSKNIFLLLQIAMRFYHNCLRKNKTVVDYLLSRGLQKETIQNFYLGYSPGFSYVIDLLRKKFSLDDIVASGIGIVGTKGNYDRFAKRVMFPILDHQGRCVGFSARILPNDPRAKTTGKYINTPETEIYHKSKVLFGYYQAKQSILDKKNVVIVEGNMDVIMLHQSGFANTVGVSGTACTDEHIKLIHRLTDNCILAFDRDTAGVSAIHKTAAKCFSMGISVSVVIFPEKDPAEVLQYGIEKWQKYIDQRVDYIDYVVLSAKEIPTQMEKLAFLKKTAFPALVSVPEKVILAQAIESLARGFAWSVDDLMHDFLKFLKEAESLPDVGATRSEVVPGTSAIKMDSYEETLEDIACVTKLLIDDFSDIEKTLYEYLPKEVINQYVINVPQKKMAILGGQVELFDKNEKWKYFISLCQYGQIVYLEKKYQESLIEIRTYEKDKTSQQDVYLQKLVDSQKLSARIHTLRESMIQNS